MFARTDRVAEVSATVGSGVEVFEVEPQVLDRLADADTPQGVLAVVARHDATLAEVARRPRLVLLDGIQDPGNAGAVVRTAAAAGFDAVIAGIGTADLWSPRAVRASAGAVFAVQVVRRVDAVEALRVTGEHGHVRVGAATGGSTDVDALEPAPAMTLVLGSEAHGVSDVALAEVDLRVGVPMRPPVESLNVAVTAGIVMYRMRVHGS